MYKDGAQEASATIKCCHQVSDHAAAAMAGTPLSDTQSCTAVALAPAAHPPYRRCSWHVSCWFPFVPQVAVATAEDALSLQTSPARRRIGAACMNTSVP